MRREKKQLLVVTGGLGPHLGGRSNLVALQGTKLSYRLTLTFGPGEWDFLSIFGAINNPYEQWLLCWPQLPPDCWTMIREEFFQNDAPLGASKNTLL